MELSYGQESTIWRVFNILTKKYNKDHWTKHTSRHITSIGSKKLTKKIDPETLEEIEKYLLYLKNELLGLLEEESEFNRLFLEVQSAVLKRYRTGLKVVPTSKDNLEETKLKNKDLIIKYINDISDNKEYFLLVMKYARRIIWGTNNSTNGKPDPESDDIHVLIFRFYKANSGKYKATMNNFLKWEEYNQVNFDTVIGKIADWLNLNWRKIDDIKGYLEENKKDS